MKFDVVIMNPPYKSSLHLKFLQKGVNITKNNGYIECVHPSTWLFMGNKGNRTKKIYNSIKDKLADYKVKLKFFNGNKIFNVSMFVPFCITSIQKSKKDSHIIVEDKLADKVFEYNDIYDVNKFGDYKEHYSLLSTISKQAEKDNLENHRHTTENGGKEQSYNYYVNMAVIRGHVSINNDDNMLSDDFYTFIPKDTVVQTEITKKVYFGFGTEIEASNFLSYLKTKFARFALALIKCNSQLSRGEMLLVPYLDFKEEWTDEKLKKEFKINEKEWNFITDIIQNYYE